MAKTVESATLTARRDIDPSLAMFLLRPESGVPDFRPGQFVTLGLPGEIRAYSQNAVSCVVLAISGRTASLEAIDKTAWVRVPDEVEQVYMTFTHQNSLVSLRGRLSSTGVVGEMRFAVTDEAHVRPDSPTRATVTLPLRVSRAGSTDSVAAATIDISTNGLLIECDLPVHGGEILECALSLPNRAGESVVVGQVVNVAVGGFAVTFAQGRIDPDTQLALFDLVTKRRRLEWIRGATTAVGRSGRDL